MRLKEVFVHRRVNLSKFLFNNVDTSWEAMSVLHIPHLQILHEGWIDKVYKVLLSYKQSGANKTIQEFIKDLSDHQIEIRFVVSEYFDAELLTYSSEKHVLTLSYPKDIQITPQTKILDLPKQILSAAIHEIAHSRQPEKLRRSSTQPPISSAEFDTTSKGLRYLTQPSERGPISLDLAQELLNLNKTPKDMTSTINTIINNFQTTEPRQFNSYLKKALIQQGFYSTGGGNLFPFLYEYLRLKYTIERGLQLPNNETNESVRHLEKQSRFLIRLIVKQYPKIKGYSNI